MNFLQLHERLRLETWRRIDQGILSGSLLARRTGLAQAHISNFLHRRRRLSLAALNRVLVAQELRVEDLSAGAGPPFDSAEHHPLQPAEIVRVVPQATALSSPLIPLAKVQGSLQLPVGWLSGLPVRRSLARRAWERFVAVRISGAQALPMDPVLRVGSLVVLDRHYNSLATLHPPLPNLYGVRSGNQLLFRHVVFESGRLVLRPRALEYPVEVIELTPHETPADLLIGRVCLCISET
jgi:transcriptional regulator with XRE-family HTH domain